MITAQQVKQLRDRTGVSMMACKEALVSSDGDIEKAIQLLKKRGQTAALKKGERSTKEGIIAAYVHSNHKLGALVELHCETDFVARNTEFQELGRQLAIQVVGFDPQYISLDEAPEEEKNKLKKEIDQELKLDNKGDEIKEKAVQSKLEKIMRERSLLTQPYYKDQEKTVEELIKEKIVKLGENIKVARFVRFSLT